MTLTTMKDDNMTTLLRRTCSTCCSYSGGECCAEDAAIAAFWLTLGVTPGRSLPDGLSGSTDA